MSRWSACPSLRLCHRWLLAAAALALTIVPAEASAQGDRRQPLRNWVQFTVGDGLPSDFVMAALDVPGDGLWATTAGGVARYNGFRWEAVPLPPGLDVPTVLVPGGARSVVGIAHGQLVTGTARGLRHVPIHIDGRAMTFSACARLPEGPVLLLGKDRRLYEWDGTTCRLHGASARLGPVLDLRQAGQTGVWILSPGGLSSWGGAAGWMPRLRMGVVPFAYWAVFEQDGNAWAYLEAPLEFRGLWHWEGSKPPRRLGSAVSSPIRSIAAAGSDTILAVHHSGETTRLQGEAWSGSHAGSTRLGDARAAGTRPNGDVWVATGHGLLVGESSSNRWSFLSFPTPDDANSVSDVLRTRDGDLWLATGRGLVRIGPTGAVDRVFKAGTETLGSLTGLAEDRQGRFWVSSGYGLAGVRWRDQQGWHRLTTDPLLDSSFIHRIAVDRTGGTWFLGLAEDQPDAGLTSRDGPGAFRLGPDGRIDRWGTPEGLASGRVYAFAEGPDGAYWFGTAAGLSRWKGGTWRHWNRSNGLRSERVFTLAIDRGGVVWFGQQSQGLGRVEGNRVEYFTTRDGLAGDAVWSVRVDDRNRLWIGCEGGVSVLADGTWTSFDHRNDLPSTRIWPILPEDDWAHFGSNGAGLISLKLSDPSPAPTVLVDPPLVEPAGVLVRWRASAWWGELPSQAVQTRVRLDDGRWTAWSREREARYFNLAPGAHALRIQAKGLLGHESERVDVAFTIPPPLVRRPQFYLPVAGLALTIVALIGFIFMRQRRHTSQIREREQWFVRAFQGSPLAASVTTLDTGQILDVNSALERMSGYPREELVGRTVASLDIVPVEYDRVGLARALASGRPLHGLAHTLRSRSGESRNLLAYFEVIELGGRACVLGQYLDVTEQRRLEEQLRQAQKMESIGRLAGGVAHDFNNLLTVILGNASLLEASLPPDDPNRAEVEQLKAAGERAEQLTRQLLAFARRQLVEPQVVNASEVVLRTDRMLRRLIGADVELVTLPATDLASVLIDPTQLEQVLVNMAVNARDAMPEGGTLTIRTENRVLDEADRSGPPNVPPGRYVHLSIEDTGVGMDGHTLANAFEPFFTTKGPGEGTGLGLAMCYGVISQAGGVVYAESGRGRGTVFHIYLPAHDAGAPAAEPRERTADTPGGAETILLAEDEGQVRRLAAQVLRSRGYQVLEATTGGEALAVAKRHPGRIDLLLTDVVMPQVGGVELADRLGALRPATRILFMSGYTNDEVFRKELGARRAAFLAKPFTPAHLALKVREILDER